MRLIGKLPKSSRARLTYLGMVNSPQSPGREYVPHTRKAARRDLQLLEILYEAPGSILILDVAGDAPGVKVALDRCGAAS